MGIGLLWIESLAAGLLLFATAIAVFSNSKRGILRRMLLCLVIGIPLLVGLAETGFSLVLYTGHYVDHWLGYTLSWSLALLAGLILILWKGLRRNDGRAAAMNWPVTNLGIGLVAAVALHLITFWNLDSNMRLRLSAVRMEAGAMALAAAPPRVPDHENAAFIYEKCFENDARIQKLVLKDRSDKSISWFSKISYSDYKTSDPELREYLRQMQSTLIQLRRASAMSGCYFEHEYAQPSIDMLLPELAHMRQLARVLAVDARVKVADGKVGEAIEDIIAMHRLSLHVSTEPILISGLVAVALEHMSTDMLEGILTLTTPTQADLAAWQFDEAFSFRRALRRCMAGEEAFGMSAFAMLGGDSDTATILRYHGVNPDTALPIAGPYWRVFLLADDLAEYRIQMKSLREMASQDFSSVLPNLDAMQKRSETQRMGLMCNLLMPTQSRAFKSFVRGEARHRLADMAVAVAAYRAKNGKYPAQAQDLVPDFMGDVPTDPYDNKPLRLIATPTGVRLYSVGEDMKDGGGTTNDFETGDVLFNIGVAPAGEKKLGSQ